MKKSIKFNKILLTLIIGLIMIKTLAAESFSEQFYKQELKLINGETFQFSKLKNKVVLIVNTASNCGFTGQYKDLEELHDLYQEKGLEVLGFPSNDFGSQEPGTNEEIVNFCTQKFEVSFKLFEKSQVKNDPKNPLYTLLTEKSDDKFKGKIGWNFVKFLINKEGEISGRYSSMKNPKKLKNKIESLLE